GADEAEGALQRPAGPAPRRRGGDLDRPRRRARAPLRPRADRGVPGLPAGVQELLHQPGPGAGAGHGALRLRPLQGHHAGGGADRAPRRHRDLPLWRPSPALPRGDGEPRPPLAHHAGGGGRRVPRLRLLRLRPARPAPPSLCRVLPLQGEVRGAPRAADRLPRRRLLRPAGGRGPPRDPVGFGGAEAPCLGGSMNYGVTAVVFLVLSIGLCWVGKVVYGLFHPRVRVDREMTARDNVAFAVPLGAYYLAILIVMGAPLSGQPRADFARDLLSLVGWGILAMVLLN